MKKIELEDDELAALEGLVRQGGTGIYAVKRIFAVAIENLGDIRNIDPKGNMGLQALAAQNACKMLEEVRDTIINARAPVAGMPARGTGELPKGSFR